MLVFISNLQLNDGTLAPLLSTEAVELFVAKLNELALAASHRADGSNRPLDVIDLVLLGDAIDLIGSTQWLSTGARPWHDPGSPETFAAFDRIMRSVVEQNESVLEIFRGLAGGELIRFPRDQHAVAVRIHYMVGDRDWPLHLPGQLASQLRRQLAQAMGLANRTDLPFPHDSTEDDKLTAVLRRHRACARHGDIYDSIHFEADRNVCSIADIIAIELFARFSLQTQQFRNAISAETVAGLAAIHDVRPMLVASRWIDAVLNRTCDSAATSAKIRSTWDRLVDEMLESTALRASQLRYPVDLADALASALKFRRPTRAGSRSASAAASLDWLSANDSARSHFRHALSETAAGPQAHVVYGHTHSAESLPLDVAQTTSCQRRSAAPHCFTTGSWRRVISPHGISDGDMISLVAIYEPDERSGQPFEIWTDRFDQHSVSRRVAA